MKKNKEVCRDWISLSLSNVTLLSLGRGGIFARGKIKSNLLDIIFLKKIFFFEKKKLDFQEVTFLCQGNCQKIGVRICRNSFNRRNKYVHV